MSAAAVALVLLLGGESEGAAMIEAVSEASVLERRQRRVAGALALSSGAVQLTTGALFFHAGDGSASALSRAGRTTMTAGGVGVVLGVLALARPGPLTKLRATDAYARLLADPSSPQSVLAFDRAWADAARKARKTRLVVGSISIAAGTALATVSAVRVFGLTRTQEDTLIDLPMMLAGIGILGTGVARVVLESETERSHARHSARRRRINATVGPGTIAISGRF